jgi:hypothetical protein
VDLYGDPSSVDLIARDTMDDDNFTDQMFWNGLKRFIDIDSFTHPLDRSNPLLGADEAFHSDR